MIRKLLVTALMTISATAIHGTTTFGTQKSTTTLRNEFVLIDDFEDLIKQATVLFSEKKYDESLAKCATAAKLRPTDFRPYYISGAVYMAQWKMKSASEAFAKAISLNPSEKALYVNKSRADRNRNAKEDAVAAAREAIKIDASYAEAYVALADALSIGASGYDEIIAAYRTAIKLKPSLLNAYKELGMFLKVSKDYQGAEDIYRKVMELDPNKMIGRFELGRLLVDVGRLQEARELWNGRSSDVDRTFPNFITLLERAEKRKAASEDLSKNPNDPEVQLRMGLIVMEGEPWNRDGRQEKAVVYFKKALELKPDFVNAQFALCKAYVEIAVRTKSMNEETDKEISKLREMDKKLADEIEAYRKSFTGSLRVGAETNDQ